MLVKVHRVKGSQQRLQWQQHSCSLGVAEMDATHREFITLVKRLSEADHAGFAALFDALQTHLQAHFDAEDARMRACGFPARAEHSGEHRRLLVELAQFSTQVQRGRQTLVRAWVNSSLPDWFRLHLATMDSALAAHWKRHLATPDRQQR